MKNYNLLSRVRRKKKKYINSAEPVIVPHFLECQFEASTPKGKRKKCCFLLPRKALI